MNSKFLGFPIVNIQWLAFLQVVHVQRC